MVYKYHAACGCFLGNNRENNEDNFYFHNKHLPVKNAALKKPIKCEGTTAEPVLFAVFDGMGGEAKGEEAALLSCEAFAEEYSKLERIVVPGKEFMHRACEKANAAVNARMRECICSMGSTVAALLLLQDEVISCNVGDSKTFRIRDNKMLQISEDHTDEKILLAMGVKKKPVLLQYIGVADTEMSLDPYISRGDILPEDIYLLCSDGVTDVLNLNDIYEIVCRNSTEEAVRKILAEVDLANGTDNATVIIVKMN